MSNIGPPIARLMRRVSVDARSGCWLCTRSLNTPGYAHMIVGGRVTSGHRVMYEASRRCKIPQGYQIDHLCRTRNCVNPAHLRCVTGGDNTRAGNNAQRDKTTCDRGHAFTEENTRRYKTRDGYNARKCRACQRENAARYHAARLVAK